MKSERHLQTKVSSRTTVIVAGVRVTDAGLSLSQDSENVPSAIVDRYLYSSSSSLSSFNTHIAK
jgi:hypothetical protein